ncbi:MAG: AAA family ATPase [Phycisphaeraceae bacterium]|nr:AAA family ATPase [Phycisphaeraceae bacterium]
MSTSADENAVPPGTAPHGWLAIGAERIEGGWRYPERDAQGDRIGTITRWDAPAMGKPRYTAAKQSKRGLIFPADGLPAYAGTSKRDPVLVAEGASDAVCLISWGFTAVGVPMAGRGAENLAVLLKDRHVVIVGDNDEPGRRSVDTLLAALARSCASVGTAFPPAPHKDIRAWVADGGADDKDIAQLIGTAQPHTEAVAKADAPGPVLRCLADIEPREVRWLWPGRVPLGRISLLVGRPGEGKSFLTTALAAHVSTGRTWPDASACPAGSVILVSAEDDPHDTIRPRLDAHGADGRSGTVAPFSCIGPRPVSVTGTCRNARSGRCEATGSARVTREAPRRFTSTSTSSPIRRRTAAHGSAATCPSPRLALRPSRDDSSPGCSCRRRPVRTAVRVTPSTPKPRLTRSNCGRRSDHRCRTSQLARLSVISRSAGGQSQRASSMYSSRTPRWRAASAPHRSSSANRAAASTDSKRVVGPSKMRSTRGASAGRTGSIVSIASPSARSRRSNRSLPKRAGSSERGRSSTCPMRSTPISPSAASVSSSRPSARMGSEASASRCPPSDTTATLRSPKRATAHAQPNVGAIAARASNPSLRTAVTTRSAIASSPPNKCVPPVTSMSNPSGASAATTGENRIAHAASAPSAARSRSGRCSSRWPPAACSSARACAAVIPGRTPAAAERAQHRATTRFCPLVPTSSTNSGGTSRGFARRRRRLARSVAHVGRYNDKALRTIPLHDPPPCSLRRAHSLAAHQFHRPSRLGPGRRAHHPARRRGHRLQLPRRPGQQPQPAARPRRKLQPARRGHVQPAPVRDHRRHRRAPQRQVDRPQLRTRVRRVDEHRPPQQHVAVVPAQHQRRRVRPAPPPDPHHHRFLAAGLQRQPGEMGEHEQRRSPAPALLLRREPLVRRPAG